MGYSPWDHTESDMTLTKHACTACLLLGIKFLLFDSISYFQESLFHHLKTWLVSSGFCCSAEKWL